MRRGPVGTPAQWAALRNDYSAAKTDRLRRPRRGIDYQGSSADYHAWSDFDWLKIIEYVRDMDRNDAVPGQLIDRATLNTIQGGFVLDPDTGDKALDEDLWARWQSWSTDASQCDVAGERTFPEMEYATLRARHFDGDIFALPLADEQSLQLVEAHRCRTPGNTKQNVIHGVLLGARRQRLEYWFTRDDIDPRIPVSKVSDMERIAARDPDGNRLVFHIADPKRVSQTRGMSVFTPVFDYLGMFEDTNFAQLVKAQMAASFAILDSADIGADVGPPSQIGSLDTETRADGTTQYIEGIRPGMKIDARAGHRLTGFSPNVPNAEYFEHVKFLLKIIGGAVGMPLVLTLMDASETNFSGWRGAMKQAEMGFKRNQFIQEVRFNRPVYRWKVGQWIASDPVLRAVAVRLGERVYQHKWNKPTWESVQPKDDAEADDKRARTLQTSPRRIHAERGQEFETVADEALDDRAYVIRGAMERAKQLSTDDDSVNWRDLVPPDFLAQGSASSSGALAPADGRGETPLSSGSPASPAPATDDTDADGGQ